MAIGLVLDLISITFKAVSTNSDACTKHFVRQAKTLTFVSGTVAYACNFGSLAQPCWAYKRQEASAAITAQCGWYMSGWYNAGQGEVSYGYEDFCKYPGSNFCGRGTSG